MRKSFFEDPKMTKDKKEQLIKGMISLVREHYDLHDTDDEAITVAITENMQSLQELMGSIKASITIQEKKKLAEAMAAADGTPGNGF